MKMDESFEDVGFLSDDNLGFYDVFENDYSELWGFCKDLNRMAQSLCYSEHIQINECNLNDVVLTSLFIKSLEDYQATLLLSSKGMSQQAMTQARALLESVIIWMACLKDREYLKIYLDCDESEVRRTFMKIKDVAEQSYRLELEELCFNMSKNMKFELNVAVRRSGMLKYYNKFYSFMSHVAHTLPRSIERKLDTSKKSFIHEPLLRPQGFILKTVLDIFQFGYGHWIEYLNCETKEWSQFINEIELFLNSQEQKELDVYDF